MSFEKNIGDHKKIIDDALNVFFTKKHSSFQEIDPVLSKLLSAVWQQTLRSGKRIRPFLADTSYKLAGGTNASASLHLGMALEILHQYFMVHDDIVDRDEKRYGDDSLHITYAKHFFAQYGKNDPHLGLSLGMIGGDLLNSLATDIVLHIPVEDSLKHVLLTALLDTIYKTTAGWQIHFFMNQQPISDVREKDFLKGMSLVSAHYTFEAPLLLGAKLAVNTSVSKILSEYAYHTGMSFQIHDDILGMFGNSDVMGKPVGNDYREGKKTILVLESYKNANSEQKMFLSTTLGTNIDQNTLSQAKTLMEETGALTYSQTLAKTHSQKAKSALSSLPQSEQKEILLELADFVYRRDR